MFKRPVTETLPVAPLKLIALDSCPALGMEVNRLLVEERHKAVNHLLTSLGYENSTYLVDYDCPRFGTGEAKAVINESVRGSDLFILADIVNPSIPYIMNHRVTFKSPDDHFQDLKRIISACSGQAARINVILPYLYEGRQHRRDKPESLDCAMALQELYNMGVENLITFDVHDPRVQNAIPLKGFDNFYTSLQFIRALIETEPDVRFDSKHFIVISPDEGGMSRSVYYSSVIGVDMGTFYKRRDYSVIENGRNPIIAHEYLGNDVKGKQILIVDDMISSGESILEVAAELKKRGAGKIFIAAAFGLFTEGLDAFDFSYKQGMFDRIFTTNLIFTPPGLCERPYYTCVDLSRYLALIIDTLNHDSSVNEILDPLEKIQELLEERNGNK